MFILRNLNEFICENGMHKREIMINYVGYRNIMNVNSILNYLCENDICSQVQNLKKKWLLSLMLMMKLNTNIYYDTFGKNMRK